MTKAPGSPGSDKGQRGDEGNGRKGRYRKRRRSKSGPRPKGPIVETKALDTGLLVDVLDPAPDLSPLPHRLSSPPSRGPDPLTARQDPKAGPRSASLDSDGETARRPARMHAERADTDRGGHGPRSPFGRPKGRTSLEDRRRQALADEKIDPSRLYAALDLGTNNCRLLIATPQGDGFRVIEAFSRIVRLGEGLTHTGLLQAEAMERALSALKICAEKIRRRKVTRLKAVATQACRAALNGAEFVAKVERETGLHLTIISPDEEARLAVQGCANLLDRSQDAAIVLDVGGGSTELSWLDLRPSRTASAAGLVKAWVSIPVGVVTLAERFPEPPFGTTQDAWYRSMVEDVKAKVKAFRGAEGLRPLFEAGHTHMIGTSGAITSLAGLHLGLRRYDRNRVDGLWLTAEDCHKAVVKLVDLGHDGRAEEPCIGPERADLVLAGAAILEAVQELWPCARIRVADRGLREGMLLSQMKTQKRKKRRKTNRKPKMTPKPQDEKTPD